MFKSKQLLLKLNKFFKYLERYLIGDQGSTFFDSVILEKKIEKKVMKVNVWCEILDARTIGPFFFYTNF